MSLENRLICAARSAFYGVYEKARLHSERMHANQMMFYGRDPFVSVLIPTFNRAGLLTTRCLPSVLAQTYTNLEIIVADHGSTDYTEPRALTAMNEWRMAGRLGDVIRVPRRRTYPPTAENHWLAGPVDPLNAALKAARGAWLARIDDDDEWTPDHVETLLRFAQAGNYEFVSSDYDVYGGGRLTIGAERGIGGTQTWLWRSYLKFMRYNPDCWRKSWDRVNDMDLADRFRRAGVRIGYLDEVTAIIRPRPGEAFVGSKAYLADKAKTEQTYKFG